MARYNVSSYYGVVKVYVSFNTLFVSDDNTSVGA
jgi:hypothetical protein